MIRRIMNHCVLIGLHSDEQNHVHMVPESIQYCIDSRVNMNVFYAYILALNATVRIGIMNDADAVFNDFIYRVVNMRCSANHVSGTIGWFAVM